MVAPYARGKLLRALRLGGHGDVTDSHLAWEIKSDTPDVPTPAAVGDAIIVCTDKGKVMELDVATGKVRVERDLPAGRDAFSASPAVTQSHVYVTRENGTTYVLDRQQELKVIAENRMDESVIATPVLIQNRVLLRTAEHLYCLGS